MESEIETRINDVPNEVLSEIFSYLSVEDIIRSVRLTCSRWLYVSNDRSLWNKVSFIPPVNLRYPDFTKYLSHFPFLKSVIFRHISFYGLSLNFATNLKSVRYENKTEIELGGIASKLRTCVHLKTFEVYSKRIGIHLDFPKMFGDIHARNRLSVCRVKDIPYSLSHFTNTITEKRDEITIIHFNHDLTGELFSMICSCNNLRYLFLNHVGSSYEYTNFHALSNLKFLKSLQIINMEGSLEIQLEPGIFKAGIFTNMTKLEIVRGGSVVKSALNSLLAACPNLRHLNLHENNLKDEDLENIKLCRHLEYLDVSENNYLSDSFLVYLALGCTKLKFLDINNCRNISDLFVVLLSPCRNLDILIIEAANLTGMFFNFIPIFLPKLVQLNIGKYRDRDMLRSLWLRMPNLRITISNVVIKGVIVNDKVSLQISGLMFL
ncbi:hypothetical protein C0J52_26706 [Blattella germanica]|nr:hypothetical protein C0J52_26706 [Blattella germanica]